MLVRLDAGQKNWAEGGALGSALTITCACSYCLSAVLAAPMAASFGQSPVWALRFLLGFGGIGHCGATHCVSRLGCRHSGQHSESGTRTIQKVCVWCVFEMHMLSVHLIFLNHCFYLFK